jgi:hypothetical protein
MKPFPATYGTLTKENEIMDLAPRNRGVTKGLPRGDLISVDEEKSRFRLLSLRQEVEGWLRTNRKREEYELLTEKFSQARTTLSRIGSGIICPKNLTE